MVVGIEDGIFVETFNLFSNTLLPRPKSIYMDDFAIFDKLYLVTSQGEI